MLNKMKSSVLYTRMESAAYDAKNKVKNAAGNCTFSNVAKTACKVSSVNNTVKAGMCAVGTVTGTVAGTTVAPAAAVTGAIYYGSKAVCHGTLAKMLDKQQNKR